MVWGLHCDEDVDLIALGVAAMGWDRLGDLSRLDPDREAFKAAIRTGYAGAKTRTVAQWAGQLYRFVHEARTGDMVVYRERAGGPINVGTVDGPYRHAPGERYAQRRPVKWIEIGLVPQSFPPEALYELGASLTWFRIKRHADLWLSVSND